MAQQIFSYLSFNLYEIIALSAFFLFFITQILLYVLHYAAPLRAVKKGDAEEEHEIESQSPFVSVIIISENESENLEEHLPLLLTQDYPNYEVIVVNSGSTDESDFLLLSLQHKYPNLYHTYLPSNSLDKKFDRRKLALTLGIKAAKGDVLLFTEPYCRPMSNRWIASMMQPMEADKDIVLGYSYYSSSRKFYNRIARFDNLLFSLDYIQRALKGKPFTGVYRNVAYRKHLFFDNKGFSSVLNIDGGEQVFLNNMMDDTNTSVALDQDSFVETRIDSGILWRQMKRSYFQVRSHFNKHHSLRAFDSSTRYIFYLISILLVAYGIYMAQWGVVAVTALLFISLFVVQGILLNKSAKYFFSGKFAFSLPVLSLMQPIYNAMCQKGSCRKKR